MERGKLTAGRRLSLGAMVTALTLLFLYASEVLTGFRFLCGCLCSLFIVILTEEDLFGPAWLCFWPYPSWAFSSALTTSAGSST